MSVYMGLKKKRCSEPMPLPVHEPSHGPNGLITEKVARLWSPSPSLICWYNICKLPPSFVNQLFIIINLWP